MVLQDKRTVCGGQELAWDDPPTDGPTHLHMGGCQNYGPFLGTLNIRCRKINKDPKRDQHFDNHPHEINFQMGS